MKDSRLGLIVTTLIIISTVLYTGCGGGSPRMAQPTPTPAGPGNAFVYTANAGAGNISGFANDSTGALAPIAGSPFASAGQPFGIAATPNSKFLYVSSFQNATVIGFAINPTTGSLMALSCGTTATTGTQPSKIAISPSGSLLYTANQSGSVSGFSIDTTTGCLTAISTTPTDAVARGLTIERSGKFLYVVTGGGGIDGFSIAADGTLTRVTSAGFNSPGTNMLAVKASPNTDVLIFTDVVGFNEFRVFTINTGTGALTFTASVGTNTTPSAIAYNRNPRFSDVYVANTGSNNLTATAVTPQGEVFPLVLRTLFDSATVGPIDIDTDPAGKALYIAGNGSSNITVISIQAGSGDPVISTVPTGSSPESIVVVAKP